MAKKEIIPYLLNGNADSFLVTHENGDKQLIGKNVCINFRGSDSKVTSFRLKGVEISQGGNDCSDFWMQLLGPDQEPFPYLSWEDMFATADLIYNS